MFLFVKGDHRLVKIHTVAKRGGIGNGLEMEHKILLLLDNLLYAMHIDQADAIFEGKAVEHGGIGWK